MNTLDPVIAHIVGLLGFDCLWLCNEHAGMDWNRMGHLLRTAAMNDMDTMIRTSKGGYTGFVRPLELAPPARPRASSPSDAARSTAATPAGSTA